MEEEEVKQIFNDKTIIMTSSNLTDERKRYDARMEPTTNCSDLDPSPSIGKLGS